MKLGWWRTVFLAFQEFDTQGGNRGICQDVRGSRMFFYFLFFIFKFNKF